MMLHIIVRLRPMSISSREALAWLHVAFTRNVSDPNYGAKLPADVALGCIPAVSSVAV